MALLNTHTSKRILPALLLGCLLAVAPLPHRGRHPNEYHEYVINGMQKAADEVRDNAEIFLQKFNEYVIEPVKQHPELLRKESWR